MHAARAPWYIFFAAFGTFLAGFTVLAGVVKPKLDERKAALASREVAPERGGAARREGAPAANGGPVDADAPRVARGRVEDARGQPIHGAAVELVAADGSTVGTTMTDASGEWTIPGVAGTHFELHVGAPGFQAARGGEAAMTRDSLEFGAVALRDGGALRLRVSGDVAGALDAATVTLHRHGELPTAPSLALATTADDGTALLRGLDTGRYRLRAEAPDHAAAELDWQFDGVGRDGHGELAFVLLPLVDTLTGEVRDDRHQSIGGGAVEARLIRPEPPADQCWRGEVAADGTFRIGPLPRGTFELRLLADGVVQQGHLFAKSDGPPVEIVAAHGGAIEGRFIAEATLVSPPAIELWRVNPDGHSQPARLPVTLGVDLAAQTFRLDGVSPGRYFVRATGDGFAPSRSAHFTTAVGLAAEEVVLELSSGSALRGRLIDHRGAPIANARITAWEGFAPPPRAWAELYPADARQSAASADDGRFELAALSSGTQVMVIEVPGQPPRSFGPLAAFAGADIELGDLSIGGGAVLSLTLRSSAGVPAAAGTVRVSSADGAVDLIGVADRDGNLCLRGLAAGNYTLAPGDGGEPSTAVLADGATARHELEHVAD